MACSCQPPVTTQLGLGRSWPVAFGRTKNISSARPAHRARDAARAARGRRAARQICVFEAAAPRSGGRAVRRGARARRARVGSGAGPPGGARGAAPAGGRARAGRWRRPARRGAGAGRRHFRHICVLLQTTPDSHFALTAPSSTLLITPTQAAQMDGVHGGESAQEGCARPGSPPAPIRAPGGDRTRRFLHRDRLCPCLGRQVERNALKRAEIRRHASVRDHDRWYARPARSSPMSRALDDGDSLERP